jgi:hypothetical protein
MYVSQYFLHVMETKLIVPEILFAICKAAYTGHDVPTEVVQTNSRFSIQSVDVELKSGCKISLVLYNVKINYTSCRVFPP